MDLRYFKGNPAFSFENKKGSVRSVWEMKLERGEIVAPHAHPSGFEIYLVLDGMGEMKVGEESNTILGGDVVYIPPCAVHQASSSSATPLHVVGVLWEFDSGETEVHPPAGPEQAMPSAVDASSAISHVARLVAFAEGVKKKLREGSGARAGDTEKRLRDMEAAIMRAIGKICADYSGKL